MNCPDLDEWDLLASEALDGEPAARLRDHALRCAACREHLASARRTHVQRLRMYEAFDRDHDRLREQLLAALPDGVAGADAPAPRQGLRLREFFMSLNTVTTRRAAALLLPAACILVAVGVFLWPGSEKNAFAAAVARIRTATTIVCRFQTFMNDAETPLQTGTLRLSGLHGMQFDARMDTAGIGESGGFSMSLVHPKGGPLVVLQPTFKIAMRLHVPDGFAGGIAGVWDQSTPDAFIDGFRRLTGEADRRLERRNLDGVEVEGYEVSAARLGLEPLGATPSSQGAENVARLWVDARTLLPVRMEIEVTQEMMGMGAIHLRAAYDRFEFDTPLDASLFVPNVPAEFRVVEATVPTMGEETMLAALRLFAEVTGHYPVALDPARVTSEVMVKLAASGKVKADPADPSAVFTDELVQNTMTLSMGVAYAQQLVRDGRNPEYFGSVVAPGDAAETLMRWTLPDGGQRIVYGDLHVETRPN